MEDRLHGYWFEDIELGMSAVFGKTFTDADVFAYAGASGDTNPLHLHQGFAAGTRFGGCIVHGMLTAGLISTLIGTKLPGPGCAWVGQDLRFKAPVRVGDTVNAIATATKLMPERNFVELDTKCLVGDTVVVDGRATVWVPSKSA